MSDARPTETGLAEIVERKLPAIAELCRRFGVRRLDLFGSAVTGRFDLARSDLDFLVEFETPPAGGFRGPYFGLLAALVHGRREAIEPVRARRNSRDLPATLELDLERFSRLPLRERLLAENQDFGRGAFERAP